MFPWTLPGVVNPEHRVGSKSSAQQGTAQCHQKDKQTKPPQPKLEKNWSLIK